MKISISNIAWELKDDEEVLRLLKAEGVAALDIAPIKFFKQDMLPSEQEMVDVRSHYERTGFELVGMQSLLFGMVGLNVFHKESQSIILEHLDKVCRIASKLGIRKLTFGSPKNRDTTGLNQVEIDSLGQDFFNRLGDTALKHDVIICLEPNPTIYGCNFLTTTLEAASFVRKLNHSNVRIQLDTGTVITNEEDFESEFDGYKDLIGHVHISETHLLPLKNNEDWHAKIAKKLRETAIDLVTIEMVTHKSASPIQDIHEAIKLTKRYYL